MKPCRILAVDDDAACREILARKITRMGHKLDLADSAEEALGLYEMGKYDVLILDVGLPRMSGIELIRVIRSVDDRVGIIVVTGWPSQEVEDACEGQNVWAIILKDITMSELDKKIVDACELANMPREKETSIATAFGVEADKANELHRNLLNETHTDLKVPGKE